MPAAVIAISIPLASQGSGAAVADLGVTGSAVPDTTVNRAGVASSRAGDTRAAAPGRLLPTAVFVVWGERCRSARRAVSHYRELTWSRQDARAGRRADRTPIVRGKSCRWARFSAATWRARARAAAKALERFEAYHYDWRSWLPDKWQRVGACETGYGRRPGDWSWNSGSYQGAFGFARSSWDAFVGRADPKAGPYPSEAYLATPRQQYEVALAIWRAFGFSGWGCRGA